MYGQRKSKIKSSLKLIIFKLGYLIQKTLIFFFFFFTMIVLVVIKICPFLLLRGTHGYMAPEVLQKGTAYDSSADWFSLGCMLFKLLRG